VRVGDLCLVADAHKTAPDDEVDRIGAERIA